MTGVLGFDIGGPKTHAARAEDGLVVDQALSGSANVTTIGAAEAGRQLDILLERLGAKDIRAVCAGAADADTEAGQARMVFELADSGDQPSSQIVDAAAAALTALVLAVTDVRVLDVDPVRGAVQLAQRKLPGARIRDKVTETL